MANQPINGSIKNCCTILSKQIKLKTKYIVNATDKSQHYE